MNASIPPTAEKIRYGITFKLGILLAAFGVLTNGLAGYYTYHATRDILVSEASRDLLQATQVMGRRFAIMTNEASKDALSFAKIGSLQDAMGNGEKSAAVRRTLAEYFRASLVEHPEYFQARFISARDHGIELVRVDRDGDKVKIISGIELQEKQHYSYVYETLHMAAGEVNYSRIFINREEGAHAGLRQPTLQVATPVVNSSGKVIGVIVINVDLNYLFNMLKADLRGEYQIYLANQDGDFLIHPDRSKTFGFDYGRRFLMQDTFHQALDIVDGKAATAIALSPVDGGNQEILGGFAKIAFGEKSEHRFVIFGLTVPLDIVLKGTDRLAKNSVRIVLAFSVLAIALSVLLAFVFVRPLKYLVESVQRFSMTRELSPVRIRRRDELGLLARSIAQMQEHLLAHLNELNMRKDVMEYKARHDVLTGAPNREMFFDLLRFSISSARRNGTQLAVLFVDLDHFKAINDNYGHAAGDAVLIAVVQRMTSVIRESDALARLSGDEFAVMIQLAEDKARVEFVAQKIIDALREPIAFGKVMLKVSASVGISIFPKDGDSPEELLHNADAAMYNSKRKGRGVFCFYSGMH
jgi:diguanylate cyclase (GGDEF)-like protein